MTLSLQKATEQVALNLTKRGLVIQKDINVSLLLDFSYSMNSHYRHNGAVSRILQRLLSIANTIDDDGNLELAIFSNKAEYYRTVNVSEFDSVNNIISDLTRKYDMNGTNFAPGIYKILDVLAKASTETKGFFKKLFNPSISTDYSKIQGKQLIVLISDGDNQDEYDFKKAVSQIEQLPNVYLQCIAVGFDSNSMKEAANNSDSIGYTSLSDFSKTDDDLINSIINQELLTKFSKV